jgi:hypothetical protein
MGPPDYTISPTLSPYRVRCEFSRPISRKREPMTLSACSASRSRDYAVKQRLNCSRAKKSSKRIVQFLRTRRKLPMQQSASARFGSLRSSNIDSFNKRVVSRVPVRPENAIHARRPQDPRPESVRECHAPRPPEPRHLLDQAQRKHPRQ